MRSLLFVSVFVTKLMGMFSVSVCRRYLCCGGYSEVLIVFAETSEAQQQLELNKSAFKYRERSMSGVIFLDLC